MKNKGTQFLAEAAILTAMGGLIGIVLGVIGGDAICSIISSSMEMTITPGISLKTILAATLFSCAVGVFFGIYPAKMPPYETAFVFMKEDYQDIDVPPWAIKLILDSEDLEK